MSNRNRLSRVAARLAKKLAKKLAASCWQTLAQETRGQEIAEAAIVLPIVFMVLIGIFWFGQAFRIYGTLTQAAQVAAEAAANPSCTTCAGGTASANAYAAVKSSFAAAHLDPTKLVTPPPQPGLNSCVPPGGTVSCDGTPVNVCVQEAVQLSSTTTGAGVCGVSVTLQYPYQFWFPGTSLSNQTINLTGSARVRSETH
jgi:Flp pilus assembly protein TadG